MIRSDSLVLVLAVCVVLVGASAAWADDYQAAARDLCKCQEPINAKSAEMMAAVQKAQATGDFSQMTKLQEDMEAMQGEVEACFDGLTQKYPEIAKDDAKKRQVGDIAEQRCPNPVKAMFGR